MVTTSVEDTSHLRYHAISYVWQEHVEYSQIVLDEKLIAVPRSAKLALEGILARNRWEGPSSSILFWIDAICINQQDHIEKSAQVAMMAEIYARADRALVWLGDSDDTAKVAFKTIHLLADDCNRLTHGGQDYDINGRNFRESSGASYMPDLAGQQAHYQDLPIPAGCDWDALTEFLGRRWFTRLWVTQEVVRTRKAIIITSDEYLPWSTFPLAIRWSVHHRDKCWPSPIQSDHHEVNFEVYNRLMHVDLTCLLAERAMEPTLDLALQYNSNLNCSEPANRVYALLGLLEPKERYLTPDYTRSVKDIYADATYLGLGSGVRTGLLITAAMGCGFDEALDREWPSWVVRFGMWQQHRQDIQTAGRILDIIHNHDASNGQSPCYTRSLHGNVLHIRGVHVGKIIACWRPDTHESQINDEPHGDPTTALSTVSRALVSLLQPNSFADFNES